MRNSKCVFKMKNFVGKNMFNKATATSGFFLSTTGVPTANAAYAYSDYISVFPATAIALSESQNTIYYDANKTFVSYAGGATKTIPAGVYFIRNNLYLASLNIFQIEVGASATAYSPFLTSALNTTGVIDRSRYKNNGTLSGGAVYKLLPTPLYVLDFTSSTSLCTIPKNASINDMAQFTVRGWVYYNGTGGADNGRVISKGANKNLYIDGANNRLYFTHGFSTTLGVWLTPTSGFSLGWHEVQVTYDNSATANNPVIMVDGVSVTVTRFQAPVGTANLDNASDLILGNIAGSGRFLNGYLSELEIYKGILTVVEGKRFYNATCLKYNKPKIH